MDNVLGIRTSSMDSKGLRCNNLCGSARKKLVWVGHPPIAQNQNHTARNAGVSSLAHLKLEDVTTSYTNSMSHNTWSNKMIQQDMSHIFRGQGLGIGLVV